jgi:hypothetical protein
MLGFSQDGVRTPNHTGPHPRSGPVWGAVPNLSRRSGLGFGQCSQSEPDCTSNRRDTSIIGRFPYIIKSNLHSNPVVNRKSVVSAFVVEIKG